MKKKFYPRNKNNDKQHEKESIHSLSPPVLDFDFVGIDVVVHGVRPCPLPGFLFLLIAILRVQVRRLPIHTGMCKWVTEERLDGYQHFRYRQCQTPIGTKRIQADITVNIDVGMKYLRYETYDRRNHWVTK